MNRTDMATAFQAARSILSRGANSSRKVPSEKHFICCALHEAARRRLISQGTADEARALIERRMTLGQQHPITLEAWLERVGAIPDATLVDFWEIQRYRRRWLKALIAEFQRPDSAKV